MTSRLGIVIGVMTWGCLAASQPPIPRIPVSFEPNRGQFERAVQFASRGGGVRLTLEKDGVGIAFDGAEPASTVHMRFTGRNRAAHWSPEADSGARTNYLVGDPKGWVSGVPRFEKARLANLYPGIDLLFYGSGEQLEYDFVVHPGADPRAIRYRVAGASVRLTAQGDVALEAGGHTLLHRKPVAYQGSTKVEAGFVAHGSEIALAVGAYNHSADLVIDPVLFAQVLPGKSSFLKGVTVDASGNIYAVGGADSSFTTTAGTAQTKFGGGSNDAIVLKFSSAGVLQWATYLGGTDADYANAVALDSAGNIIVMGTTASKDFPMKGASLQTQNKGGKDAFVAKLDSKGATVLYSTYYGGTGDDVVDAGALDSKGNIVVVGTTSSTDLKTAGTPLQAANAGGQSDFLIFKISGDGATMMFATYLGGNSYDEASAMALDSSDNIYLAGTSISSDLKTTAGVVGAKPYGNTDAVVAKLDPTGSTLGFLTYLGGADSDYPRGITVTPDGAQVWVTGTTRSANFPVSANALQKNNAGGADAFLTRLDNKGALVASTYFGGAGDDEGDSVALRHDGLPIMVSVITTTNYDPASTVAKPAASDTRAAGSAPETMFAAISLDGSRVVDSAPYQDVTFLYLNGGNCNCSSGVIVCAGTAFGYSYSTNGALLAAVDKSATAPAININPPSLVFNSTPVGVTSAPQIIEVKNTGTADLTIKNIPNTVFGTGFSYTTTCSPVTLVPNQTCTFTVTFTPTSTAISTASIPLTTNVPPGNQTIALRGAGFGPGISWSLNLTAAPTLWTGTSAPTLNFSQVGNTAAAAQTLYVVNTGSDVLKITNIQTPVAGSGFNYSTTCLDGPIQAGNSCNFTVTFPLQAIGNYSGTIVLTDNVSGGPHTISLAASATAAPAPGISVSPNSITFPTTFIGTSSARQIVTVNSIGTAPLLIKSYSIDDGGDYSFTDVDCGKKNPLASKDSCQMAVEFHPNTAGRAPTAILSVLSSAPTTATASLAGSGTKVCAADSDGDGLCDDWERNGYTAWVNGKDVFVNLPAMGADPNHKDIFVQVDYMKTADGVVGSHSHAFRPAAAQIVVDAFANSPVDSGAGVTIHIDCGADCPMKPGATWGADLSLAKNLPEQAAFASTIDNVWPPFDRLSVSFLATGRALAFHHTIFVHEIAPGDDTSGISRNADTDQDKTFYRGASDFIVSLGDAPGHPSGTDWQQAGTFMHELGHNLGLAHGGGDGVNRKPNYLSIMNYNFQLTGLTKDSNSGVFDYSRFRLPDLNEDQLNELAGLSGGSSFPDYGTAWWCAEVDPKIPTQLIFVWKTTLHANAPIDWDCSGHFENPERTDINKTGSAGILHSQFDWDKLVYTGGAIAGQGASLSAGTTSPSQEQTTNEGSLETTVTKVTISHPQSISLGVGGTATVPLIVSNAGTAADSYALTATPAPGWLDASALPATVSLQPGASSQTQVKISVPASAKAGDTQQLFIRAHSQNGTAAETALIEVTVMATPAPLTLSVATLVFGATTAGTPGAPQPITLTNTSGAFQSISTIVATGDFSQTNNCGVSLTPGASCIIQVTFLPTADGTRNGTLTISSSTAGGPRVINLTGNILRPTPDPSAAAITSVNTAGGGAEIAQNTWIEIKGRNLVPAATPASGVVWSAAPEFASGRMPTQLGGVSVTVNGKPAFVYFFCSAVTAGICASDQINVLTPLDSTEGLVNIVVTSGSGTTPPFAVTMKTVAPSFLLFSAPYVVATHVNGALLGPPSLYPGYTTPAKPNEQVVLFAVGFGLPTAALTNGSSSQSGSLPTLPVCKVGSNLAAVGFAGLIGPGLYQLNLTIPAGTDDNDQGLTCTYNGVNTPAGDQITVHQ